MDERSLSFRNHSYHVKCVQIDAGVRIIEVTDTRGVAQKYHTFDAVDVEGLKKIVNLHHRNFSGYDETTHGIVTGLIEKDRSPTGRASLDNELEQATLVCDELTFLSGTMYITFYDEIKGVMDAIAVAATAEKSGLVAITNDGKVEVVAAIFAFFGPIGSLLGFCLKQVDANMRREYLSKIRKFATSVPTNSIQTFAEKIARLLTRAHFHRRRYVNRNDAKHTAASILRFITESSTLVNDNEAPLHAFDYVWHARVDTEERLSPQERIFLLKEISYDEKIEELPVKVSLMVSHIRQIVRESRRKYCRKISQVAFKALHGGDGSLEACERLKEMARVSTDTPHDILVDLMNHFIISKSSMRENSLDTMLVETLLDPAHRNQGASLILETYAQDLAPHEELHVAARVAERAKFGVDKALLRKREKMILTLSRLIKKYLFNAEASSLLYNKGENNVSEEQALNQNDHDEEKHA